METGTIEPAPAADNQAAHIAVVRRVIPRSQGDLRGKFVVAMEKKIRIR